MCSISLLIPPSLSSSLFFPIRLPFALLSLLSFLLMSPLLSVLRPPYVCVSMFVCSGGVVREKGVYKVLACAQLCLFTTQPLSLSPVASEAGQSIHLTYSFTLFLLPLSQAKLQRQGERESDMTSVHLHWSFILEPPLSSCHSFCCSHSQFLPCVDWGSVYHSATGSMARFLAFV